MMSVSQLPRRMTTALEVGIKLIYVIALVTVVGVLFQGSIDLRTGKVDRDSDAISVKLPVHFIPKGFNDVRASRDDLGSAAPVVMASEGDLDVTLPLPLALLVTLLSTAVTLLPAWFVLRMLSRIFAAISRQEPFSDAVTNRLRWVGVALLSVPLLDNARQAAIWMLTGTEIEVSGLEFVAFAIDFTPILAGLTVLVLAEAFRYGEQLRTDSELTV